MPSAAHAFASSPGTAARGPRSSAGVRRCRPRSLLSWLLTSGLAASSLMRTASTGLAAVPCPDAHRVVRAPSSRRQAVVAAANPVTSLMSPHHAALAVERPRQGDAAPYGECVPASGELIQAGQDAFAQRRLQQLQHVRRHARPPDRQLAAVTCPQLPQRLAAPSQILRAAHIRALGRSRNPFRLPARLTPQPFRVSRPEDVALPGSDLAEDTTGQARLGLHQEVHGIMRQVIVIARTMPRGELRSPLSDDRHQVAAPSHFSERHVHRRHGNRATGRRHTGFPHPRDLSPVLPIDAKVRRAACRVGRDTRVTARRKPA